MHLDKIMIEFYMRFSVPLKIWHFQLKVSITNEM